MTKPVSVFLHHIIDSIELIEDFTKDVSKNEFLQSPKTQDAVIRRLEIIGEATKNLQKSFTQKYPDVPWSEIARTRDKLVHGYFGVDLQITWNVITDDLPELKEKIKKILEELQE